MSFRINSSPCILHTPNEANCWSMCEAYIVNTFWILNTHADPSLLVLCPDCEDLWRNWRNLPSCNYYNLHRAFTWRVISAQCAMYIQSDSVWQSNRWKKHLNGFSSCCLYSRVQDTQTTQKRMFILDFHKTYWLNFERFDHRFNFMELHNHPCKII